MFKIQWGYKRPYALGTSSCFQKLHILHYQPIIVIENSTQILFVCANVRRHDLHVAGPMVYGESVRNTTCIGKICFMCVYPHGCHNIHQCVFEYSWMAICKSLFSLCWLEPNMNDIRYAWTSANNKFKHEWFDIGLFC